MNSADIRSAGVPDRSDDTDEIRFSFEGQVIHSPPGISLAAALAKAGEYQLRATDDAAFRGVYCGIGVCQECRVDVAGAGRVRACMTPVSPGMTVTRATRLVEPGVKPATAATDAVQVPVAPDIFIIGGGAGGLMAAAHAAESGATVVLVDERSTAGGQYYKQPHAAGGTHRSLADDAQMREGKKLVERATTSGALILENAQVWGAFAPAEFAVLHQGKTNILRPKCTIVATGAYERGLPVPGWTLPGVMTSGAAQTMLKSYGVVPGQRILVAGNGPLNLQVALELKRAGAEISAVTELAPTPMRRPMAAASLLLNNLQLGIRGLRHIAGLRSAGVPLHYGHGLQSIEKSATGLRAWTGRLNGSGIAQENAHDVDIVCMGYGFHPNNEILRCLGCRHEFDKARDQLIAIRNHDCETSVPGVFAIGDCCGLRGAPAALDEATIAASAAIRSLSSAPSAQLLKDEKIARTSIKQHIRFQASLWQVFSAPRLQTELATPQTFVCRCENVTMADIEQSLHEGCESMGAVKRHTRLGMGPCQGRYCAPLLAHLLAVREGVEPGEYSYFAPRVPVKPVRISEIVQTD